LTARGEGYGQDAFINSGLVGPQRRKNPMNKSPKLFRRCVSSLVGLALGVSVSAAEARPLPVTICRGQVNAAEPAHFRGCTDVIGDVRIEHSSAKTLQELAALRRVTGALVIADNPSLTSLSGLSNLRSVQSLVIQQNPELQSVDGLERLEEVTSIQIEHNHALVEVTGPNSLEHVDELRVRDNGIVRLTGFHHLVSAGDLVIADNARLIYAPGLSRLVTIENLTLAHNPRLAPVSGFFSSLTQVSGRFSLSHCPGVHKGDVLRDG
jgi:hypothetical protein